MARRPTTADVSAEPIGVQRLNRERAGRKILRARHRLPLGCRQLWPISGTGIRGPDRRVGLSRSYKLSEAVPSCGAAAGAGEAATDTPESRLFVVLSAVKMACT